MADGGGQCTSPRRTRRSAPASPIGPAQLSGAPIRRLEHFSNGSSSFQVLLATTWRDRSARPTVGFRSIAGSTARASPASSSALDVTGTPAARRAGVDAHPSALPSSPDVTQRPFANCLTEICRCPGSLPQPRSDARTGRSLPGAPHCRLPRVALLCRPHPVPPGHRCTVRGEVGRSARC